MFMKWMVLITLAMISTWGNAQEIFCPEGSSPDPQNSSCVCPNGDYPDQNGGCTGTGCFGTGFSVDDAMRVNLCRSGRVWNKFRNRCVCRRGNTSCHRQRRQGRR